MDTQRAGLAGLAFVALGGPASAFVPGTPVQVRDDAVVGSQVAPSSLQEKSEVPAATAQEGSLSSATVPGLTLGLAVGGVALKKVSQRRRSAVATGKPQSAVICHAFESELGVQAPVGFFDPLGFCKDGDETKFKRRRASELKHGRWCMLAAMGYITPEYFRLPGFLSPSGSMQFADMPNGLAALSKVPLAGGMQIFLWMCVLECTLYRQDGSRAPGDFENIGNLGVPFAEGIPDPEKRKRGLNSELANGRLAMVAIMGMMFQNGFLGTTGPEMWIPASAFEGELGVQPPLGYWDPLGLAKDGDADVFYRRRCTEIKHGRVGMWAAMGYIAPEYVRWPGYLSPSNNISFDDVPNGLAAFSKVPAVGWAQIFLFCGFMELFNARQDPSNPPGMLTGYDGPFGKGVEFGRLGIFRGDRIADPEARKRALNSEIANGRLGMVAVTGMMFQNGFLGTTGPEMWIPGSAFESELGVQAPVGFFDPLGFCKDGDEAKFKRRRASELKHGRWCMLAAMGYITPEYFRLPGFLSPSGSMQFADMPNGLAALSKVPLAGGMQIFLWMCVLECTLYRQDGSRAPGDFENIGNLGVPFAEGIPDPEKRKRGLNSELANGRLAMVAIMGMMFQNGFIGTTGPEMWIPGSAFEGELGVQPPLGYWDPLGFAKDGDADVFYRRRCTEIKHGRVGMWAAMGFITPEYVRWPGYLSPSNNISFDDVPNGLAAFSKVPAAGWAQIFLFCGFMEVFNARQDPSNPPGMLTGYDGPFGKGVEFGRLGIFRGDRIADPAAKKRALNSELANGRLAMVAVTGMMFQNGFIGTTGPEMWIPGSAFEGELGVQAPVGFFDPLGFCKDGDEAKFKRRRASELKHGRWCMLAAMGYITPEYFRLPGFLSPSGSMQFADMPNGLAALSKVPLAGGMQIFLWMCVLECTIYRQDGSRAPGDFENIGNLGVPYAEGIPDPEKRKRGLNSELANGRLAMVAITGMMFQNGFIGTTGPEMWIPASAFEGELGVQPPLGYWDPLGLAKDGDADVFYRRRCTEIKHGRVGMWAAMGYIAPEYVRWPGYLSPSNNISFDDVPNGLAAFSKVPAVGWAQIFLFCGFMELFNARQDPSNPPGMLTGYDGPFGKGVEFGRLGIFRGDRIADPAARKRALNSELANGRLGMVAVTGMMFQNGFIGTTGPEMWIPGSAFEGELGVQAPVGFFDPLGFCKDGDEAKFKRRRASELKHGRWCMLATMGYITPEYFRLPGFLSPSGSIQFQEMPNGLAAMSKVPLAGGMQIFLWLCVLECTIYRQDGSRAPGDFENVGNLGVPFAEGIPDPEKRKRGLNSELANGRLAMVAITGMMFQNGFLGTTGPEMWMPASAFEGELGVQPPVGFFDPLGLSKDGDADVFFRRRCTEIKHGRVSMWAAMGYIAPEYFRWPGYLSPSEGMKFDDVPNGLAAFSKVPAAGWMQIFLFCGFMEIFNARQEPSNPPGQLTGFEGPWGKGVEFGRLGIFRGDRIADPAAKKRALNSELANGRLAMVAITGMMFQNGFIGTTGPEMWIPGA